MLIFSYAGDAKILSFLIEFYTIKTVILWYYSLPNPTVFDTLFVIKNIFDNQKVSTPR